MMVNDEKIYQNPQDSACTVKPFRTGFLAENDHTLDLHKFYKIKMRLCMIRWCNINFIIYLRTQCTESLSVLIN